jgi:LCP family protein required for cell wall assembly
MPMSNAPPAPAEHPNLARRTLAGVLSMLVPGTGQAFRGAWRRGALLFALFLAVALPLAVLAAARPLGTASGFAEGRLLAAAVAVNLVLLALRLFAALDAWRWRATSASLPALAVAAALVALTAAPHVAAGYVTVRGEVALERVFAEDEPDDVLPARGVFLRGEDATGRNVLPGERPPPPPLPNESLGGAPEVLVGDEPPLERPWVTILLLGSDEGPGQPGDRTDSMILAALERDTGRAVAFGVPRNIVGVPLAKPAAEQLKRFPRPLNALYRFATEERPELFPGGPNPGATAMKQTISKLLGLRVDYYAMVNLDGFRDVIDALGGVTITPRERLKDELTRPAWGETKPKIDVYPGRTYHFNGRTALAYVRSRKDSDDYTRMHRQRCFLTAVADQLDVVSVLRNFGSIARTIEQSVSTDIPRSRLPDLIRLVSRIDSKETLTVTFGRRYIARRRADGWPIPKLAAMKVTAREAILDLRPDAEREVETVRRAC